MVLKHNEIKIIERAVSKGDRQMRYSNSIRSFDDNRTPKPLRATPRDALVYSLAKQIGTRLWRLMQDQTHYLIVARNDVNYFVQFIPTELGHLHGEAVSNDFLIYDGEDHRIDTHQQHQLSNLGWSLAPINYTQLWEQPILYCEIGIVAARTLIEVYGTTTDHIINYKFGEIQR